MNKDLKEVFLVFEKTLQRVTQELKKQTRTWLKGYAYYTPGSIQAHYYKACHFVIKRGIVIKEKVVDFNFYDETHVPAHSRKSNKKFVLEINVYDNSIKLLLAPKIKIIKKVMEHEVQDEVVVMWV